jgi:Fe-S cluster biogenesis protein NfuA
VDESNAGASLCQRVQRVVTDEILPLLQMDGGGLEVLGVEDGVVRVRLLGTCSGCPATIQSVILCVEQELRNKIEGVEYLEAVP